MATDVADVSDLYVGGQNVSDKASGAYTGEIAAAMLESLEVDYCIIGHSERRKYFNETDEVLAVKANQLLEHNIRPIYCCGELLEQRENNTHFDVVRQQLKNGLFHLEDEAFKNIVIAYEPVWAIGTGVTASPDQAQEMHAFIRNLIADEYGTAIADNTTILYGGSCNSGNAKELFANPDVDGGLIGGASLKAEEFIKIAESF
jgi:triosephosphate isomerase